MPKPSKKKPVKKKIVAKKKPKTVKSSPLSKPKRPRFKLEVLEMLNDGDENYFKIAVRTNHGKEAIESLISMLDDLELRQFREEEPDKSIKEKLFPDFVPIDYSRWVGQHRFFQNSVFKIHVIFSQGIIHMIVKCATFDKDRLMEVVNKYCLWAKKY